MMKPGSVLINTARADLVDENALAAALRARSVGAYATDVLDGDPAAADSPLLAKDLMPYVTVTPHLGAQTVEAVDKMGQMALANVAAVLRGDSPLTP
jgi:D-3-phosphoglycerate dehydrogenase